MATQIDLGKVRPVWKGDWAGSTAYEKNDMVLHGVNSYICVTAHTSGSSFSDSNWNVIAYGADIPSQSGQTGSYLTTDGSSLSWGTVTTNLRDKAWFTFLDSADLRDIFSAGASGGDRAVMPFNNVLDPFDIIGTAGSNQFQVNATGYYDVDAGHSGHSNAHYHPPYVYNNTDGAFAPRPNGSFSGSESWMTATPSYANQQDPRSNTASEPYYLVAGKNYSFRVSTEQTGGLGTNTGYLNGGYTVGGIQKYNAPFKAAITKLSGV